MWAWGKEGYGWLLRSLCYIINKESTRGFLWSWKMLTEIGKSELSVGQIYIAPCLSLKVLSWNQNNRRCIMGVIWGRNNRRVKEVVELRTSLQTLPLGIWKISTHWADYFQVLMSLKKITFPAETAASFPSKICSSHVLNICCQEKKNLSSTLDTSVQAKATLTSLNESGWAHPRFHFGTYLVFYQRLECDENFKLKISTSFDAIHCLVWDV